LRSSLTWADSGGDAAREESPARVGDIDARVVAIGSGPPVVVLGAGFSDSDGCRALARRFRVIAVEPEEANLVEREPQRLGECAARWIEEQGHERIGLIAFERAAAAALFCAAKLGEERATALVIGSPQDLPIDVEDPPGDPARGDDPLRALPKEVRTPKAILIGTEDPAVARRATSRLKKSFSRAFVVLVAGAGRSIHVERPEAFASVAGDFLDRQARFRLETASVALQP